MTMRATKTVCRWDVLAFAAAVGATAVPTRATIVVDYSGVEAVTGSVALNGTVTTTTNSNLDGVGSNDSRSIRPYSETLKFNPSSAAYAPPAGKSGVFYGGAMSTYYDTTTVTGFARMEIRNVSGDPITFESKPNATGSSSSLHALVYMKKADFLNGLQDQNVAMDATSSFQIAQAATSGGAGVLPSGRFALRQNGSWYLSSMTFTTGTTLTNPAGATTWAPWDPASDLNFDQANATFTTLPLNAVDALGYYLEHDSLAASAAAFIESRMTTFRVNAVAVPEPGALGAVAIACGVARRRRRRGPSPVA